MCWNVGCWNHSIKPAHGSSSAMAAFRARRAPPPPAKTLEPRIRTVIGWRHLAKATCPMQPHLCYALYVVSRIIIRCYIRPMCSTSLPCNSKYTCPCSSRLSVFKGLFGLCFSVWRRGNHVRVRAYHVRPECNMSERLRLFITDATKHTERNPTCLFQRVLEGSSREIGLESDGPGR